MLLVGYTSTEPDCEVILTFQRSTWSVMTGGIVKVVFSVIRSMIVVVETSPFLSVVTEAVYHATSSDVVNRGNETVVVDDSINGGRIYKQGGSQ